MVKGITGSCTSPILERLIDGPPKDIFKLNSDVHKQDAGVLCNFGKPFLVDDLKFSKCDVRVFIGGDIVGKSLVRLHVFRWANLEAKSIFSGASSHSKVRVN